MTEASDDFNSARLHLEDAAHLAVTAPANHRAVAEAAVGIGYALLAIAELLEDDSNETFVQAIHAMRGKHPRPLRDDDPVSES